MRGFCQRKPNLLPMDDFYLAHQKGADIQHIQTEQMQTFARDRSNPLTIYELTEIIAAHQLFLASGGGGGTWKLYTVTGTVFGVYVHPQKNHKGRQAHLDMKRLDMDLSLQELDLPYASFCGAYIKRQDLSDAMLLGSIFCDAYLEGCIFADANISRCDFSRANLRYASFMNANLTYSDFENCDLTGADFRGALLEGARFPGAILNGVKR